MTEKVKISTLKDLRDNLNKISDEDLEQFALGVAEEDDEVGIVALPNNPEDEGYAEAMVLFEKNPITEHIRKYISKVIDLGIKCNDQEIEDESGGLVEYSEE